MAVAEPGHHSWPGLVHVAGGCGIGLLWEGGQGLPLPYALRMATTWSWSVLPGAPHKESARASVFNSSQHFTTSTTYGGQLLLIHTSLHGAGVQPYKIYLFPHGTMKQEEILVHKWAGSALSQLWFISWRRITVTLFLTYSITFIGIIFFFSTINNDTVNIYVMICILPIFSLCVSFFLKFFKQITHNTFGQKCMINNNIKGCLNDY